MTDQGIKASGNGPLDEHAVGYHSPLECILWGERVMATMREAPWWRRGSLSRKYRRCCVDWPPETEGEREMLNDAGPETTDGPHTIGDPLKLKCDETAATSQRIALRLEALRKGRSG